MDARVRERLAAIDVAAIARRRTDTPRVLEALATDTGKIAAALVESLTAGGTVYACGNGGSAAEATHFAAEFVGRFQRDRRALSAVSLSDNVATITALANDYDFDDVYAHQIRGLGRKGDCLLALSTSGNSENIVRACVAAREAGLGVFGLTGASGGRTAALCDISLRVPFEDTARVQEVHLMILHIMCEVVEDALFPPRDA